MFCPHCGSKMDDNAVFCTACGARVKTDEQPASEQPVQPEQPIQAEQPIQPEQPVQPDPDAQTQQQGAWQQPAADPFQAQPAPQMPPVDASAQPAAGAQAPKDYLVVNIILTAASLFLCCLSCLSLFGLITGIIGIVFSTQVKSAVAAGNFALAEQKSHTAKIMWIVTAVILGLSLLMFVIIMATGLSQNLMDYVQNMMY